MNRKDFIKNCGLACIGGMVAPLMQSCTSTSYFARYNMDGENISIPKTEFLTGKSKLRRYILIKTLKFNYPISIYHLGNNRYSAMLMECTHKGCELTPQGDLIICPCHGSEFSNTGMVLNPPAEKNLHTFKITSDNEFIYIRI